MLRRQRLDREAVESGRRRLARAQRREQRVFVDEPAARGVEADHPHVHRVDHARETNADADEADEADEADRAAAELDALVRRLVPMAGAHALV